MPLGEDHPLDPLTPYAASKAASGHLVRTYAATFGVDAVVVRPFNNYGPRQNEMRYAGVIPSMLTSFFEGRVFAIFGDGQQTRDYLYAEDTARAVLQLYGCPETRGRIVNIASGQAISLLALKATIERILGREIPCAHHAPRPGDVRQHVADVSLLKSLVDFRPRLTLDEGLERTIAFYARRYERAIER